MLWVCAKKRMFSSLLAAGNDGCECLHIPAALESVLAVGAMDAQGKPLDFSIYYLLRRKKHESSHSMSTRYA